MCNEVMPPNPVDFSFHGIDGRGRQELVRDPGRGGAAVVRIEDPQRGSEGCTFDLEWRFTGGRGDFGGRRESSWGWRGNSGSTFNYHGDGRGFLNRRDGRDMRVRDVTVRLNEDGRVDLEFQAEGLERLAFVGRATNYNRDSITADLAGGGRSRDVRGEATIYLDRNGEVERVTMSGRMEGDPFKLNWSAR